MLYLLAILKFLFWLLVWVLGILFVILFLVLFVPIRYQFQGEYGQSICGRFRCSWLFYFVMFQVAYENNQIQYLFKILGFTLYPKKQKKRKRIKKKKKQLEPIGHLTTEEETIENEQNKKNSSVDTLNKTQEMFEHSDVHSEYKDKNIDNINDVEEKEQKEIENQEIDEPKIDEHPYFIKRIGMWIKKVFQGIKNIVKAIISVGKNWKNKKEVIQKFLKNEKTKKAYTDCKYYAKKAILHLIPRKLNGEFHFGFEDPAKTGEVLSVLSLALPFYKNNIRIIPYFDQTKLEGKLKGKGRVSLGVCLYILCRVWFHKELRITIKRAKKLLK